MQLRLLDDINLAGARGVLVNITAGLDLSIGEFEEVGEVIKGFTSESATVVVGTVIDPELSNELRVTIVVTGLGREQEMPMINKLADSTRSDGTLDYHNLDRPTVLRKQGNVNMTRAVPTPIAETASSTDMDYLDIPAFLRRQEEVL